MIIIHGVDNRTLPRLVAAALEWLTHDVLVAPWWRVL
jgi:hypothetical protein